LSGRKHQLLAQLGGAMTGVGGGDVQLRGGGELSGAGGAVHGNNNTMLGGNVMHGGNNSSLANCISPSSDLRMDVSDVGMEGNLYTDDIVSSLSVSKLNTVFSYLLDTY